MRAMAWVPGVSVSRLAQALGSDDRLQILLGGLEVFVNYNIIELGRVRHFFFGTRHAAANDLVGVLSARAHAPFEFRDGGRQDEDADRFGQEPAHLLRALPVDLE